MEDNPNFVIHKSTFIVKNVKLIDDVYERQSKVSIYSTLHGIESEALLYGSNFSRLFVRPSAREHTVRL